MQSLPTITPKSKSRPLNQGIMGHLRHIGAEVIKETANVPADLAKTAIESVGGKVTPINPEEHKEYLYGKSLGPEEREALKQKQATEQQSTESKLAQERQKIQAILKFKHDRATMEAPIQNEPTVQEVLQKEQQDEQQKNVEKAQNQQKFGSGLLPQGTNKKPGLFGMIRKKRGDVGRMEMGKGT